MTGPGQIIQHEVLYWAQDPPTPECYFFILHKHGSAIIGLKHFWSTKSSTFGNSKMLLK